MVGAAPSSTDRRVADGTLVTPHNHSAVPGGLTAADVQQIIDQGIAGANVTRSAIRLDADFTPGARSRMASSPSPTRPAKFSVCSGWKTPLVDALEVTVAKARNAAYYADAAKRRVHPEDQVAGLPRARRSQAGHSASWPARGIRTASTCPLQDPWSILQDAVRRGSISSTARQHRRPRRPALRTKRPRLRLVQSADELPGRHQPRQPQRRGVLPGRQHPHGSTRTACWSAVWGLR